MEEDPARRKTACLSCGAKFNHQSSLIRHLKNKCNRNQPQRRKACRQCAIDKSRCNLRRPSCSRCHTRGISCKYTSSEETNTPATDTRGLGVNENMPIITSDDISNSFHPQSLQSSFDPHLFDSFFSDLSSWSSVPSSDILRPPQQMNDREATSADNNHGCDFSQSGSPDFITSLQLQYFPNVNSIALANHSMELIFRILRTWPRMLAEGFQFPPIFHFTHLDQQNGLPQPLATCITLAKMWNGQCAGAEEIVRSTILKELDLIVDTPEELDEAMLLAVLQAVVVYTIILLSPSKTPQRHANDDHTVFRKVEVLIYQVVRGGLFLDEERAQTRPSWKTWIHVTSKRRAVLALYLLHWAYSVLHHDQCFDCKDLGFMPAPAPKVLWQADTEHEWNTKYIHWLSRWSGQIYLQAEFGKISAGPALNARAEKWLGETDEFELIMASIVNATDFDPPSVKTLRQ